MPTGTVPLFDAEERDAVFLSVEDCIKMDPVGLAGRVLRVTRPATGAYKGAQRKMEYALRNTSQATRHKQALLLDYRQARDLTTAFWSYCP